MNQLISSPLNQVDELIQSAIDNDDIDIVLVEINKMIQARELVGKVLAKTLYMLHQSWYLFSISEHESFTGILESINVDPYTTQRYIKVWQYMDSLPLTIQDKPIREIIPITNALAQGYNISDESWGKLERSSGLSETQRIVTHDVKNLEPRKSSLLGYLNGDGTLYCWMDGERYDVGFLNVDSKDEAVQKFINRIVNNTGIILK